MHDPETYFSRFCLQRRKRSRHAHGVRHRALHRGHLGRDRTLFHFSDTWQLVINTGTTVVTFLMVFLIQATQNRDGKAIQLKLDELIRAQKSARNVFAGLEEATEEELKKFEEEFRELRRRGLTREVAVEEAVERSTTS
jgi:low affinity Fe/Cu permease